MQYCRDALYYASVDCIAAIILEYDDARKRNGCYIFIPSKVSTFNIFHGFTSSLKLRWGLAEWRGLLGSEGRQTI
jgi:hypothetical protein